MKSMPKDSIDLVVTSPPYDNIREYENSLNWSFAVFKNIALEVSRLLKEGGVIVWVVDDQTNNFCESLTSFKHAIFFVEVCGLNLLDTMIYAKKSAGVKSTLNCRRYTPGFEYMFVFSKKRPKTFNPIIDVPNKSAGKLVKYSNIREKNGELRFRKPYVTNPYRMRNNVWLYDTGSFSATDKDVFVHPAVFPDKLARDHILSWSNEGDTVLDPFMGSGTTGKQARLLKRSFIGIERVEKYFELAKRRIFSDT